MAMVWLVVGVVWLRFAGRSGRSRGSRRSVMLIFGGWSQDLCSSHVRCLKSSAPARGRVLRRRIAELCARAGSARAASPAATGCVGSGSQRELVSLLRVVGVGVGAGLVVGAGGDLPAVGGELAGDRDRDDPAGFAPRVFELAPAGVQPALRVPGDVDDLGCVPALAALERLADDRAAAVVVGGLDQQPPGVGGAGLGDRPEPALAAGGVLGRDDPEVGGELVGMIEALPLADLRAQPERGERVDPAQAPQPGDRVRARRA